MAWTTPRTWSLGELVTSTIMNTHVRDNLVALYERPMATALTIPAANIGTTGAVWVTASTASAAISLTPNTSRVMVHASLFVVSTNQNSGVCLSLSDGTTLLGDSASGLVVLKQNSDSPVHMAGVFTGLATGVSHTFYVHLRPKAANTTSAYISAGHPISMIAHEI